MTYEQQLRAEAELWGSEAERMAQVVPPDWRYHREMRHNVLNHTPEIDALLAQVRPGMQVLELGCASGWLTLAMAQRGAHATGYDVSEKSLTVARNYYERIGHTLNGTAHYEEKDLNQLELQPDYYDIIVVKGTLHHLVNMPQVIGEVHHALKPGGLFWIADSSGDAHMNTVLLTSALMFLLPTHTPYSEKVRGLLKFGLDAPSRVKASMEAEGLSPFEGAGRDHDWLALVRERFSIDREKSMQGMTGYLNAQLNLPDDMALPLLRGLQAVELFLQRAGILKGAEIVVYARK